MQQTTNQLHYRAYTSEVYKIWIINLFLKIVTLGIYSFWGKTRIRKYLVGSFSLLDDQFEYTGTGKELFIGFLKVSPILIIIFTPLMILPEENSLYNLMLFSIAPLSYAAIFSAMRYRFSRTTWRGIRGQLQGSVLEYVLLRVRRAAVNILTLGILIPASDIKIQEYITSHTYFGSTKITFMGNASVLMPIHLITLILAIPTLGFSRLWYRAALLRHVYGSMQIDFIRFSGAQTGGNLCGLVLGNLAILIITLGFGLPFIMQRNMRYFADMLIIIGDIDTSSIMQSHEMTDSAGEGLNGVLGDADIGFAF